jgi:hypothetical protein
MADITSDTRKYDRNSCGLSLVYSATDAFRERKSLDVLARRIGMLEVTGSDNIASYTTLT